eukprot:5531937-Pyramimonas_sp.AAC.1
MEALPYILGGRGYDSMCKWMRDQPQVRNLLAPTNRQHDGQFGRQEGPRPAEVHPQRQGCPNSVQSH